jgi:hypothetical protein
VRVSRLMMLLRLAFSGLCSYSSSLVYATTAGGHHGRCSYLFRPHLPRQEKKGEREEREDVMSYVVPFSLVHCFFSDDPVAKIAVCHCRY